MGENWRWGKYLTGRQNPEKRSDHLKLKLSDSDVYT
jgi:hypothetical protein